MSQYLILGRTRSEAERVRTAFALDETLWQALPYRTPLCGRYDRIVVCLDRSVETEDYARLASHLPKDGVLVVL